MFMTHTQLTALRRVGWLLVLICALFLGGMRYTSDLGTASLPFTTEAAELSDDLPLITEVKLTASDGDACLLFLMARMPYGSHLQLSTHQI